MVNLQLAEKPVRDVTDGSLDVVDIWATVQGEGPFAGHPAIFIRLAGCNLDCYLCDTDYTNNRRRMSIEEVVEEVNQKTFGPRALLGVPCKNLVVVTGGEPLRQKCGGLVAELLDSGYEVQFETNGTLYDISMEGLYDDIHIVCSPKTATVSKYLADFVDAYKYVIAAGEVDEGDGLPTSVLGMPVRPARPHLGFDGDIYVQPLDEGDPVKNAAHTKAAVESCMKFGYKLCLQIHKIVGLP